MKEKIFVINGYYPDYNKKHGKNSFFNTENLSKIGEVVKISDPNSGFKSEDLTNLFKNHLNDHPKVVNIIIDAHGGVSQKVGHYLQTGVVKPALLNSIFNYFTMQQKSPNVILARSIKVIKELVKATKNIPLILITPSCYGAHLPPLVKEMPKGSKIMSLSNKKSQTMGQDYANNNINKLLNYFTQFELKFENIIELCALSQKITGNTPIIGVHGNDGQVHQLKLNHFAEKFIANNKKFSPFFEKLFDEKIIDRTHLIELANKIKNNSLKIKELKIPKKLFSEVQSSILANKSIEQFKTEFENKYYFPGALKSFAIEEQVIIKSLLEGINIKKNIIETLKEKNGADINNLISNIKLLTSSGKLDEAINAYLKDSHCSLKSEKSNPVENISNAAHLKQSLNNLHGIELKIEELYDLIDKFQNKDTNNYLKPFLHEISASDEFLNIVPNYSALLALGAEEALE